MVAFILRQVSPGMQVGRAGGGTWARIGSWGWGRGSPRDPSPAPHFTWPHWGPSHAGDREGAATPDRVRGTVHLQPGLPQGEVAAQTHPSQDSGPCPALGDLKSPWDPRPKAPPRSRLLLPRPAPGYHRVSSPPSSPPPPPSPVSDWRSPRPSQPLHGVYIASAPWNCSPKRGPPTTSDRGQQKCPPLGPRPSLAASGPASSRQRAHTSGRGSPSSALPTSLSSPGPGLTLSPPARTSPPTTGRATRWCARAAPRC